MADRAKAMTHATIKPPNCYDLAFMAWFRENGWRVLSSLGEITVWSGDKPCPFKVTQGMLDRLEASGQLTQFCPEGGSGLWEDWYAAV